MKRLLLVALMVLVTLVGMVGFSRATESQNIQQSMCPVIECIEVSALQSTTNPTTGAITELVETVNDGVPDRAKMYYLTVTSFTGSSAITACDSGFHMASISEIQDPSSLQYATRSTPAYDAPAYDQAFGPPSGHMGWVRTGSFSIEGVPDYCDFSMSSFDQQSGTTVSFHTPIWGDSYMDPFPSDPTTGGWQMAQVSFSLPEPVWCVEDPE
jgi:hypothetical protein